MKRTTKSEAQMLSNMRSSKAWRMFESFVLEDIEFKKQRLVDLDSMNLAEYAMLQGEIRALNGLLRWMSERDKQALEN